MAITYGEEKRARTLLERCLDFARCDEVFAGRHFTAEDDRRPYFETRFIMAGILDRRMVVMSGRFAERTAPSSA